MKRHTSPGEDLSVYRPTWSPDPQAPEIEPGAAYGAIQCVPADELPAKERVPHGFWTDLNRRILLHLEQTKRKEALRIPFASSELARRAYHSITNEALRQIGPGAVEARHVDHILFVRRGTNWDQVNDAPDPDLAALTK